MLNAPITGNDDLDAFLYQIQLENNSVSTPTAPNTGSGDPTGYLNQYIHIKYADDNVGTGFSNTQTNKSYWGIFNSTSSTESPCTLR